MIEFKAPKPFPALGEGFDDHLKIFLGGSIEMGAAEDWQTKLTADIDKLGGRIIVLNPRRDDWDASWVQDPTEGTQFHEQVTWEMNAQEEADITVYYFADDTKSPITLLELGRYGKKTRTVVRVTPNFWRYGNVKMLCDRYGITCVETYDELLDFIESKV